MLSPSLIVLLDFQRAEQRTPVPYLWGTRLRCKDHQST
jgi:hypothetical protein